MDTIEEEIQKGRKCLKAPDYHEVEKKFGDFQSDQQAGMAPPPLQKPYSADSQLIELVSPEKSPKARFDSVSHHFVITKSPL